MQILIVALIYKYTGYLNKQVVPGSYIEMDIFGDSSKMRRIDFGLNFGIGYKLPFGMFARAQYGLSMFNLSKDDNFVVRNIGFLSRRAISILLKLLQNRK